MNINNLTRFATDRLDDLKDVAGAISNEVKYAAGQLRDKAVVPAIDNSMETGLLRSDAGMYGRYLTGTSVPLTKVPLDIKRDEAAIAEKLGGFENNNKRRQGHTSLRNSIAKSDNMSKAFNSVKQLFDEQQKTGVDIKAHNMGFGKYSPEQVSKYNKSESKIQQLVQKHGRQVGPLSQNNPAPNFSDRDRSYAASEFKPFDKNNYTNQNYKAEFGDQGIVGSTANTLGQYTVKDGTVLDKYDFNRYTKGNFEAGGVITGASDTSTNLPYFLANSAGKIADKLGIINPQSGYDVRLKLR